MRATWSSFYPHQIHWRIVSRRRVIRKRILKRIRTVWDQNDISLHQSTNSINHCAVHSHKHDWTLFIEFITIINDHPTRDYTVEVRLFHWSFGNRNGPIIYGWHAMSLWLAGVLCSHLWLLVCAAPGHSHHSFQIFLSEKGLAFLVLLHFNIQQLERTSEIPLIFSCALIGCELFQFRDIWLDKRHFLFLFFFFCVLFFSFFFSLVIFNLLRILWKIHSSRNYFDKDDFCSDFILDSHDFIVCIPKTLYVLYFIYT